MPPSASGSLADVHDMHDAASALDFLLDPKPATYNNLIRRYSKYSGSIEPVHAPMSTSKKLSRSQSVTTPSRDWTIRGLTRAVEAVSIARSASKGEHFPIFSSNEPDEATIEKLRKLEQENQMLKRRLAMFESVEKEGEGDEDSAKVQRFRIRMLKARNMQLENEVLSLSGCVAGASAAYAEIMAVLRELKSRMKELQQLPNFTMPSQHQLITPTTSTTSCKGVRSAGTPDSRRSSRLTATFSSSSSGSTASRPSSGSAASPRQNAQGDIISRHSTFDEPNTPRSRARMPPPHSRPASPAVRSKSHVASSRLMDDAYESETEMGGTSSMGGTVRAKAALGGNKVAVPKEWLRDLERQCGVLEARIKSVRLPEKWMGGQEGGESDGNLVPFMEGAGNRFVVKGVSGVASVGLTDNMARILQGELPLVHCSRVHELESRLGDLYPRLLLLSNMLSSMVIPSLPVEASEQATQDVQQAVLDIHHASRCLSELAALVPGGAQLRGFGGQHATETLALQGASLGVPEEGLFQSLPPIQTKEGDQSVVSQFPSADEIMGVLPQAWVLPEAEEQTKRILEILVEKLRNAEAKWRAEMWAAQNEIDFYRGCHAAQGWHVKQVVSAGQFVLEALMGDAFIAGAAAMDSIERVLTFAEAPIHFQTPEQWRDILSKEAPSLRQFKQLYPQNLSAPKMAAGRLDPLEKEFKSRMQAVFEKLQSRRATVARARAVGSPLAAGSPRGTASSPQYPEPLSPTVFGTTPTLGSRSLAPSTPAASQGTPRLASSPAGRLTGAFARPMSPRTGSLIRPASFYASPHP